MQKKVILFFATGFFAGHSPIAPGTVGTLVGVLLFIFFRFLSPLTYSLLLALLIGFSFFIADQAEKILQEKDSGKIVIDEIVGFLVTMAWVDVSDFLPKVFLGFLFFRLTDIVKFPPAKHMEKFSGGIGVVLDDLVAGLYANFLLQISIFLWTKWG